jgi:hypothetical protein
MKVFEVILSDRRRVSVRAERYELRDGKYIFFPESSSAQQWFMEEKVIGIVVFSDDDDPVP